MIAVTHRHFTEKASFPHPAHSISVMERPLLYLLRDTCVLIAKLP
jgi:hypothetical protein